jgi:prophage maintenance system killer protein
MNGWQLHVEKNEAVQMMVELAEEGINEVQLARWINERCQRNDGYWT